MKFQIQIPIYRNKLTNYRQDGSTPKAKQLAWFSIHDGGVKLDSVGRRRRMCRSEVRGVAWIWEMKKGGALSEVGQGVEERV